MSCKLKEVTEVKPFALPHVVDSTRIRTRSPTVAWESKALSDDIDTQTQSNSRKRSRNDSLGDLEERKPKKRDSGQPYDDLDQYPGFQQAEGGDASSSAFKKEEAEQGRVLSTSANGRDFIVRDGKVLAKIEIVLPTLKDVRRRQAAHREATRAEIPSNAKAELDEHYVQPQIVPIGDVGDHVNHAETLRSAVEQMQNPEAKVKKELQFSDEFLLGALGWEGINHRYPISLPKEIAEFGFSRLYISNLYGGSMQSTFPKISADRVSFHGRGDWAFLTLEFNPHAPTRPGHSGLFFSPRKAWHGWHGTRRPLQTFVRLSESNWVYMGQYKFVPGISHSMDEWKKQKEKVRSTWVFGVHVSSWGMEVTCRVWLRKQKGPDHQPTEEEVADAKLNMRDIRQRVTLQDMMAAYDNGEEEIGTYKMTCVGYDEEFVRVLQRNAHLYVSPLINAKSNAKKGAGKKKGICSKPNAADTRKKAER